MKTYPKSTSKKYPSSNYLTIRSAIKAEYISLIETHTKFKRTGYSSLYTEVRIKHIAYSMFKGSSFESIEFKWKQPENPIHDYIKRQALVLYDSYMAKIILEVVDETVCTRP